MSHKDTDIDFVYKSKLNTTETILYTYIDANDLVGL